MKNNLFWLLCCFSVACFGLDNTLPSDDLEKISFNLQQVETKQALQYLAKIANKNIILSDNIHGTLSLEINELSWQHAFNLILQIKNLSYRSLENAIFVAPTSEIIAQQKQSLLLAQQHDDYVSLSSELITIHYSKASELGTLLKEKGHSLLSKRGNVSVDARTNTLWIEDTPQKLAEIKTFLKKLDVPMKQVLIEARIINVDTNYEEELGIKFNAQETPICNNTDTTTKSLLNHLEVDLPRTHTATRGTTTGIALAKLNKNILLDLELSAMESNQSGEIISNPKLITADQQAAMIQSGEEIPYQESTASGATNVAFKKAVLSLQVTPQVTPNNQILMNLKINQDKRGQSINGTPSIDTHQIETQVLAQNGDTIVLGGIYEQTQFHGTDRIPFISQIPIIGNILSNKSLSKSRKELIIFITPTIIPVLDRN